MNLLDAPWKRLVAAILAAAGIYLAYSTFAQSTYTQTQKIRLESARGDHCKKWSYQKNDTQNEPVCLKWSKNLSSTP